MHSECLQSCPTLWPCGLQPARLLCPWDSPGKITGVDCHLLLQGTSGPRDQTCISCISKQVLYHFPGGSEVKASACNAGDQVPSLDQEDPLKKEMATHSSTLSWKIPWMEKPGRLQSVGSQRVGHDWATSLSLSLPLVPRGKPTLWYRM